MSKDLVEKPSTAVGNVISYEDDAGGGFESAGSESYAIPFLSILQAGSPQVKKSDGAYIKGAEEGALFNSVTNELYNGDEGVQVVPCYFKRSFVKWAPRETGGGFLGEFSVSDPIIATLKTNDRNQLVDGEGNIFADSRAHYVLILDGEGGFSPAVISLSSSQIKKSRQWMSKMQGLKAKRADGSIFTPPMFSHVYTVETKAESNSKGSWYGFNFAINGEVSDRNIYLAAKAFRDSVASGEVSEKHESVSTEDSEEF